MIGTDPFDLSTHRAKLAARLQALEPVPPCKGRGIVVCAGGAQMFTNAYVLIHVLRNHLRSRLPIEVWHLGPEELSPAMIGLLDELGARVVDATARLRSRPARIRDGWQLKAYALVETSFREVLLLDCDQVPVRDPEEIFSWPEYEEAGAVFWPDIIDLSKDNPIWELCDQTPRQRPSFESGQVLVDKARHWPSLNAALYLNEHAEDFYQLVYGDKDTYLAAWLFTGAEHAFVPHRPLTDDRCLFQRDFRGEPLFQHRTNGKWTYSGEQHDVPGFQHFAACLEALTTLRRRWSGQVFRPPDRSLRARRAETELAGQGAFVLRRASESDHTIRLAHHGEVSEGRTHQLQHWFVRELNGSLELVLHDGNREICRLSSPKDLGPWNGADCIFPFAEVSLGPAATASADNDCKDIGSTLVDDILRSELSSSPFDEAMAERLETTFDVLSKADPAIGDGLLSAARRADIEAPLAAFLRCLADRLRSHSEAEQPSPKPSLRVYSILSDSSRYVRP